MQITCAQERLREGLEPVLGLKAPLWYGGEAVHISRRNGSLRLAATDLSTTIATEVSTAALIGEDETLVVPSKLLGDFVANLPAGAPVSLELDPRNAEIAIRCAAYRATLKGLAQQEGTGASFDIPSLDGGVVAAQVPPARLAEGIQQVIFAAASDDVRPALNGVYLWPNDQGLTLVTADGFRMARAVLELDDPAAKLPGVIVPLKAMARLRRILARQGEDALVSVVLCPDGGDGYNRIVFRGDGVTLASTLIEARFPDCEAIIPRSWQTRVILAAGEFREALRFVAPIADDDAFRRVALDVKGDEVTIRARECTQGSARASRTIRKEGPDACIVLNFRFLSEALAVCGATEEVAVEITAPDRPCTIRKAGRDSWVYVVMPVSDEK